MHRVATASQSIGQIPIQMALEHPVVECTARPAKVSNRILPYVSAKLNTFLGERFGAKLLSTFTLHMKILENFRSS